jgi:CHAD domain-containing protein
MSDVRRFAIKDQRDIDALVADLQARGTLVVERTAAVERTVYDTFDWRLFRTGGVIEHECPVTARGRRTAAAPPQLVWRSSRSAEVLGRLPLDEVPRFVWQLPDGPIRDRLAPIIEMRALLPLVTFRSDLTTLAMLDGEGKTVARLVIDRARLPRHPDQLVELAEVMPVRGYGRATARLSEIVAAQTDVQPTSSDTAAIALTAVGLRPGDYTGKLDLHLDPRSSALDIVISILGTLRQAMVVNEPGVRADTDSEFLHDFRVAVRRTRSVLVFARRVLPAEWHGYLCAELKWLGDITTPVRDLDVYLLSFDEFERALPPSMRSDLRPLYDFLLERQREAHDELVAGLDSDRYAVLSQRYDAWLSQPRALAAGSDQAPPPDATTPAVPFAAGLTWRAYRRMVKAARSITDESPATALHELRKDAKRLRYALECFGNLFPPDEIAPSIAALKTVQDALGDFQDAQVQRDSLRRFGEEMIAAGGTGAARAVMAMGFLIQPLDERQQAGRRRFMTCFAQFDGRANRERFRNLFGPIPTEVPF